MNFKKFYKKIGLEKDILKNKDLLNHSICKKHVLVIGGAGTIGSNYVKQILRFKPSLIVVVDIDENGLTEITRDLRSSNLLDYNPKFITYPVNLLDETFDKIFNSFSWDIVANFAAHKHVRSEKDIFSIEALLKNNVMGAIKILSLCEKSPPNYFFSVSTDKATNPVNVMGASKSLMEKIILSKKTVLRVSTARFANVAFSNGSLLYGFDKRIEKNQPISCPNDIKRFFVTPEQSGKICLLSTFLGSSGSIFFPKLDIDNDLIYFKDIATDYLKQKGFKIYFAKSEADAKNHIISNNQYPLYLFDSDTSGEKLYEEFYADHEDFDLNIYHSLGVINSHDHKISFESVISDFNNLFDKPELKKSDYVFLLKKYVPSFSHIEKEKNLDEKM